MEKIMKRDKKEKGFTLVELLIVVAIIAILAGIAIPNFMGARTKARVGKAFGDMDAIAKAEEMYEVDHGTFTNTTSNLTTNYVKNIPNDPWGQAYEVQITTAGDNYIVLCGGPNGNIGVTVTLTSTPAVRGAIGGANGAGSAYGITTSDGWYYPVTYTSGDLAYGSGY